MDEFKYFAFISYNKADEKYAKQLQKQLEAYNIPQVIRREKGIAQKKIHPVFRDKTDIGVGALEELLKEELKRSRYLIVICSPNAARSRWVDKEVREFAGMGRSDKIIPYIIDGSPDTAADAKQCYPPALGKENLGISVAELGREKAFIKVVAKLFEVGFDDLWNREARRKRKRRIIALTAVAALLGVGLTIWNGYFRDKVGYYKDFVLEGGVPKGVYRLSANEVRHRNSSWRFISRGGKVRKMTLVDSYGRINSEATTTDNINLFGSLEMHLIYDGEGRLNEIDEFDAENTLLFRRTYIDSALVAFNAVRGDDSYGKPHEKFYEYSKYIFSNGYLNGIIRQLQTNDSVKHYKYAYDGKRYRSVEFRGADRAPVSVGGIRGLRFEYNDIGQIRTLHFGLQADTVSLAMELKYDNAGNLICGQYRSNDSTKLSGFYSFDKVTYAYDAYGNLTEESFMDKAGNYVVPSVGNTPYVNYARKTLEYDECGNLTRLDFYDPNNRLILIDDIGSPTVKFGYDKRGNLDKIAYFVANGDPVINKNTGYAAVEFKYDKKNRPVRIAFYDEYGALRPINVGESQAAVFRDTYDKNGLIESAFYDEREKPCRVDGVARTVYKYKNGKLIEMRNLGVDGELCLSKNDRVAVTTYAYDGNGNIVEESYLGITRQPIYNQAGIAGYRYEYDAQGNTREIRYFDIYGNTCADSYGREGLRRNEALEDMDIIFSEISDSREEIEFNDSGDTLRVYYMDQENNPCVNIESGVHEIRFEYDGNRNMTRKARYDTNGNPAIDKTMGFFQSIDRSDGDTSVMTYWDEKGNPCLSKDGIYKTETKQDGRNVVQTYYGLDDKPAYNVRCGYAREEMTFDDKGNLTRCAYYDVNGELCVHENTLVEEGTFSKKEIREKYAAAEFKYDAAGNRIEEAYYGTGKRPFIYNQTQTRIGIINKEVSFGGYAKSSCRYDAAGNLVEQSYFGTDGNLCLYKQYFRYKDFWTESESGYAIVRHAYDSKNNLIKTAYFGTDGKPCRHFEYAAGIDVVLCSSGYAEVRYEYDSHGNKTGESYYDVNGEPYPCFFQRDELDSAKTYSGYVKVVYAYDKRGTLTNESYYDAEGKRLF